MTRLLTMLVVIGMVGCGGAVTPGGSGGDDDGSGSGSGSDPGGGGDDDGTDNTQPTYPTQHPKIYLSANKDRLKAALAAKTGPATRFVAVVDEYVAGGDLWGFEAWNAALMGQLTADPKYCGKAIAVVDAQVSAAESAIASGSAPTVAGDSYLDVGGMIADLALTYDWCFDSVDAGKRTRWLAYANQAVSNVWHHDTATWGGKAFPWSGWAIDDPSDNYYYSFLRATMLLGLAAHGEDPKADDWIKQFRDTKVMGELVPTFDSDLVGGGSREGTGYGVAMNNLWSLYDIWHATTGERLAGKTPHTRASMVSFVHQMLPTLDRVAPTGDQSRDSTASLFDYHRRYLAELIALYPADMHAAGAKGLLDNSSVPQMGQGFMKVYDFLYDNSAISGVPMSTGTVYYAPGIGELYARSGWDTHATWLNLIAGPYTQSHAHQDQGSIMLYKDGWLAYDAVVDSHSGLPQETTAHGLVRIDSGGAPVRQIADTESKLLALHRGTGWVHAAADLTPAYNGNSAVSKVQRELVYLEPDTVVVFDRVTSAAGTTQTWQLATPVAPTISGSTATIAGAKHQLHVQRLSPAATPSVYNFSSNADFSSGFRLDETTAGGDQRYLHVLSIDGSASSVAPSGATGVSVHLANGKTATVVFSRDAVGGTLTFDGANTTLGAGVDTMPK